MAAVLYALGRINHNAPHTFHRFPGYGRLLLGETYNVRVTVRFNMSITRLLVAFTMIIISITTGMTFWGLDSLFRSLTSICEAS